MSYIDDRFSFSENASWQGSDGFSFVQNSSQFSGGENIAVRQSAIAPVYSSTGTYAVGDFVMHNGELYVCITSIPIAEEWNPNHWVRTNVGDELWNMRDTVYSTYMPSEADGIVVTFEDGAEDAPLKSMVVDIPTLQSRFDDPSPTNVREVASYTGAEIQVCQKNLMPPTFTSTSSAQALSEYIRIDFEKNPSYVFSSDFQIGAVKLMVYAYDNNFVQVARTTGASFNGSRKFTKSNFTSTVVGSMDDARYIRIRYYDSSDSSTVENYHHQLEVGETATEFEPYRGRTYSVSWEDTAGAIGAGTLDVINGTLTKTWAVVDLGTLEWSSATVNTGFAIKAQIPSRKLGSAGSDVYGICSSYIFGGNAIASTIQSGLEDLHFAYQSTQNWAWFRNDSYSTVESFAASLSGVYLCYQLANPVVYPVTPLHVETFLGLNNISAGIGASTLEYRIDTKSYIDKLIEPYGEAIEELQDDVAAGAGNMLPEFCTFPESAGPNITCVWSEDKTQATISGTVSSTTYIPLYDLIDFVMPDIMEYGRQYTIKYHTDDENVKLYIEINGSGASYTGDATFEVDDGDEFNLSLRIESGAILPATVTISMPYTASNLDLQHGVDEALEAAYGAYPVDVASGAVAYFDDGVANLPVKSLKVDMKPLQDLHGYDSPWLAGGSKNKLALIAENINNESSTKNGLDATLNADSSITISGTPTASSRSVTKVVQDTSLRSQTVTFSISETLTFSCYITLAAPVGQTTLTIAAGSRSASGTVPSNCVGYQIGISGLTTGTSINKTIHFQLEIGSSATSFAPYENICPITPFAGLTLTSCGKNIIDEANADFKLNYYINASGVETSSTSYKYSQAYWSVLPDTDYAVRADSTASTPSLTIAFYDENKVFKSRVSVSTDIAATGTATFHTPVGCRYIRFSTDKANTLNFQVEVGTEATDYEAFNGSVYPVSWETVADDGEIIGGYFDTTNGTLVKTWGKIDLGSLTYSYNSTNAYFYSGAISDAVDAVTPGYVGYCTCYAVKQYSTSSSFYSDDHALTYCNKALSSAKRIFLKDTNYTDGAVLKAALSGQYLVYQLAEPVSYSLDAITVKTLAGVNNIFADVGNTTVEFRADPTMYIKKLTGSKENDMVADANIASGKYFLIGNSLYLSTAAISAGETIVPGTNCTLTNLAEALNALNV